MILIPLCDNHVVNFLKMKRADESSLALFTREHHINNIYCHSMYTTEKGRFWDLSIKFFLCIHFWRQTSNGKYPCIINKDMQRPHSSIPSFSKFSNRTQGKKIKFHHLEVRNVRISITYKPETSIHRKVHLTIINAFLRSIASQI